MMLHAVIVIPCRNEEQRLAKTCASLGFGVAGKAPPVTTLILVDNGSTDSTPKIANDIRDASPNDAVLLASEKEIGYVPPRHRGCLVARELAQRIGIKETSVLVLQADADTHYSPGYVDNMRTVAVDQNGMMLQACTSYREDFQSARPAYLQLCSEVDAEFETLFTDNSDDVIIDDKACGYYLSDYFLWGGHVREYTTHGEEVHSETTRLYIRSQKRGAVKVFVDAAETEHSARHLVDHPIVDFVTAGFPRERSWIEYLKEKFAEIDNFDSLVPDGRHPLLSIASALRKRHVLGIFGALPLHVARVSGRHSGLEDDQWVKSISLPIRSPGTLEQPALLIQDAFESLDIGLPTIDP
jgi:glycosyltransferase involved in cell wall biosynthesis